MTEGREAWKESGSEEEKRKDVIDVKEGCGRREEGMEM